MSLNHFQKKYIKKHTKKSSVDEISSVLKIPKQEIIDYLNKHKRREEKEESLDQKIRLKNHWLNLSLLTLLAIGVYFNSLGNVFLSDDLPEIVNNPNIGNLAYAIKTHPFGFIRMIFYWIAYNLGGLKPEIFRSINILLHLGNIYLVYALINILSKHKKVAFFTSAIFAIHPLLIESVVWISGGGYPQYSFFFLLSLVFYISSANKKLFYMLSILFYLLSFMSHPVMPASLILVFITYEIAFGDLKRTWVKIVPIFFIIITYVIINLISLPEREQTLSSIHYQERGVDNIFILVPVAISSYLNLIFWPKDLTLYHSELALTPTAFSIAVIEFLAFLIILALSFKKSPRLFFWLSFFFITLLPTLTPFRLNWIVAERYVYLGSIGIFASVVYILDKFLAKNPYKAVFYIILTVSIAILSFRSITRNIDWKNEDNLWIATGKTSPSSPNTHNNLGDVYGRQGNKEASIREFKKAIELKPNYADAYHNLANVYRETGKEQEALENYQKAISFNPILWQSYQNIAALYFNKNEYNKALEIIQKAVEINPNNIQLRNNLGIILLASGQKDKAREVFQLVLSADPKNQFALSGLQEASK